jgi:hypothetical protein
MSCDFQFPPKNITLETTFRSRLIPDGENVDQKVTMLKAYMCIGVEIQFQMPIFFLPKIVDDDTCSLIFQEVKLQYNIACDYRMGYNEIGI